MGAAIPLAAAVGGVDAAVPQQIKACPRSQLYKPAHMGFIFAFGIKACDHCLQFQTKKIRIGTDRMTTATVQRNLPGLRIELSAQPHRLQYLPLLREQYRLN